MEHGKRSTYTHTKCKCELCKEANAEYWRKATARNARIRASERIEGVVQNPTLLHGRPAAYLWHGCRCEECVEAVQETWRHRKAMKKLTG